MPELAIGASPPIQAFPWPVCASPHSLPSSWLCFSILIQRCQRHGPHVSHIRAVLRISSAKNKQCPAAAYCLVHDVLRNLGLLEVVEGQLSFWPGSCPLPILLARCSALLSREGGKGGRSSLAHVSDPSNKAPRRTRCLPDTLQIRS